METQRFPWFTPSSTPQFLLLSLSLSLPFTRFHTSLPLTFAIHSSALLVGSLAIRPPESVACRSRVHQRSFVWIGRASFILVHQSFSIIVDFRTPPIANIFSFFISPICGSPPSVHVAAPRSSHLFKSAESIYVL